MEEQEVRDKEWREEDVEVRTCIRLQNRNGPMEVHG